MIFASLTFFIFMKNRFQLRLLDLNFFYCCRQLLPPLLEYFQRIDALLHKIEGVIQLCSKLGRIPAELL